MNYPTFLRETTFAISGGRRYRGEDAVKARFLKVAMAIGLASIAAPGLIAQETARPVFKPDGAVQVPAFELPPSIFMSKEAIDSLRMKAMMPPMQSSPRTETIAETRQFMEQQLAPMLQMMKARYPVDVAEMKIGGVATRVFTPKDGKIDKKRVLINLHGGAFQMCADGCAQLESIPIAALGGFKVISVDYRQGPEHVFPAASEDVASVYRELLKTYKARQIGIYGCSAGGMLSGQAAAWLPAHGLPQAGAIGIFGSGSAKMGVGDSAYVTAYTDGTFPAPRGPDAPMRFGPFRSYFEGADMSSPMVLPAQDLGVLAKFPPTLVITGSRAMDMSPAIYTNSRLLKAGVDSRLIVGEGLGHCYIYQANLPEAQDAYDVIVKFFRASLGK